MLILYNFTLLQGKFATCSNNCRGVDPNSIIGAGVAPAVLGGLAVNNNKMIIMLNMMIAIASTAYLPFMTGFGGLAAGAGGSMLMRTSCPSLMCSVTTNLRSSPATVCS